MFVLCSCVFYLYFKRSRYSGSRGIQIEIIFLKLTHLLLYLYCIEFDYYERIIIPLSELYKYVKLNIIIYF